MTIAVLDTINLVTAWVAVGVVAIGPIAVGFGDKILEFLEAHRGNRYSQRDDKEE